MTGKRRSLATECARTLGLVGALVLARFGGTNLSGPSKRKLRRLVGSPGVESRRAAAERAMGAVVERVGACGGLEHVVTHWAETFSRRTEFAGFGSPAARKVTCELRAVAYFGVRGEVADVLDGLRRYGLADWLPPAEYGPARSGGPEFGTPELRIDWDRPGSPLPLRDGVRAPRRGIGSGRLRHRRWSVPPRSPGRTTRTDRADRARLADARARCGTLLVLRLGGPGRYGGTRFTVRYEK
ncbi:hypothetical protein K353_00101 [Kitasatospora sp. SolWspMP-SS2h]|uniref:hypothetical protein n=1 Tax=Kitasatospora sp. SolWspMP-SS2h TaxID=1305729 RepID=UPI000DBAA8D0|nr:hypothetical protein [Kitasatospora sp. SolWspMP-SS2h]RAJ46900.1 hypothetical protein K353_00101 [Kitasatospora sp. SolWspMP-SS2h]